MIIKERWDCRTIAVAHSVFPSIFHLPYIDPEMEYGGKSDLWHLYYTDPAAAPISVTLVNSIFQYELNSALLTSCAGISEASKRSLCMVLLVIVNYDFLNKLLMSVGSKNDENKKVLKKQNIFKLPKIQKIPHDAKLKNEHLILIILLSKCLVNPLVCSIFR